MNLLLVLFILVITDIDAQDFRSLDHVRSPAAIGFLKKKIKMLFKIWVNLKKSLQLLSWSYYT